MSLWGIVSELPATVAEFLQQKHPVALFQIYDTGRKIHTSDVNPLTPRSLSSEAVVTVGVGSLTRYLDYLARAKCHMLL